MVGSGFFLLSGLVDSFHKMPSCYINGNEAEWYEGVPQRNVIKQSMMIYPNAPSGASSAAPPKLGQGKSQNSGLEA